MKRLIGAVVLLAGVSAVPAAAAPVAGEQAVVRSAGLGQLTGLVAERIEVGDLVAASKFGTD